MRLELSSITGDAMTNMKQLLFATSMIGSIAFAGSAMAQGVDVGIGVGIPLAPGQAGTSPGQVFNSARNINPTTALPPGQLYIQNRATNPTTALPPGQTFTNYGRSRK
jgi:hypothetical protein